MAELLRRDILAKPAHVAGLAGRLVPGGVVLGWWLHRRELCLCRCQCAGYVGDAVADEIGVPFDRISLEMVYRGLYHFSQARAKGNASDPVKYFADPQNQDLGVVMRLRKPQPKLDLSPYPI